MWKCGKMQRMEQFSGCRVQVEVSLAGLQARKTKKRTSHVKRRIGGWQTLHTKYNQLTIIQSTLVIITNLTIYIFKLVEASMALSSTCTESNPRGPPPPFWIQAQEFLAVVLDLHNCGAISTVQHQHLNNIPRAKMGPPRRVPWASKAELSELYDMIFSPGANDLSRQAALSRVSQPFQTSTDSRCQCTSRRRRVPRSCTFCTVSWAPSRCRTRPQAHRRRPPRG